MSSLPSAVIVYFNGTFLERSNGAHARVATFLTFLLQNFEDVILYSFRNHPTCPWTDDLIRKFSHDFPRVKLVLEDRSTALALLTRFKNMVAALVPSLSRPILSFSMPGLTPAYRNVLRRHPSVPLVVNYADGLTQLNGIPLHRLFVETHDVKFINYRFQARKSAHALRCLFKLRSEVALLDKAQGVVAISPTEASFFRLLLDEAKVLYIPNFGRISLPVPVNDDDDRFLYDLVFVGSENVLNSDGLLAFLDSNKAWLGQYRIAVCGRVCDQPEVRRAAFSFPSLSLLGYVDDIAAIYRRSKAAISPVHGTGLKIKIVDALAQGKPVFASDLSLAGLPPGYEGCVFPIEPHAIREVLDNADARRAAERRSRSYCSVFEQLGDQDLLLALLRGEAKEAAPHTYGAAEPGAKRMRAAGGR